MDWIPWIIVTALSLRSGAVQCPDQTDCIVCGKSIDARVNDIVCVPSSKLITGYGDVPSKIRCITLGCPVSSIPIGCEFNDTITTQCTKQCDSPGEDWLQCIVQHLTTVDDDRLVIQTKKALSSTPTKHSFRGRGRISVLTLSDNGLTELPAGFLDDLEDLHLLELERNNLQNFPDNFFSTSKLGALELASNKIKSFASAAFDKLRRLYRLNVADNRLVRILPHTFDKLESLRALRIQRNYLETLPPGIFDRIPFLTLVNISENNFGPDSLPADLFRHNLLAYFFLTANMKNMTTLPHRFFADQNQLRTVDLYACGFTSFPEDLFWNSKQLRSLEIQNNYLSTLPRNFFKDSSKLSILNISSNKLYHLPDDVFASLESLQYLDLSKNHLTTVSDKLFQKVSSLLELNMKHNELVHIGINAFQHAKKLYTADFSYNFLEIAAEQEYMGRKISPFSNCTELQKLDLRHNSIVEISVESLLPLPKLRFVNLSHNRLRLLTFQGENLQFRSNFLTVDVTYNNISQVDLRRVGEWAASENTIRKVTVLIENNPIRCDCMIYDLLRYVEGRLHPNAQNMFHLKIGKLKCQGPHDFRDVFVSDLKSKTFKCNVATGQEFGQTRCPNKCECYLTPENKAFLVNCAYKGLMEAPSQLESSPAYNIEMNLTGNLLTNMPSLDQPGYNRVTILRLGHNRISSLPFNEFLHKLKFQDENLQFRMNNLTVDVTYNNISYVDLRRVDDSAASENTTRKVTVLIENNPIRCDCMIYDLLRYVEGRLHPNAQNMFHLKIGKLKCQRPQDFRDILVADLKSETFKSNVSCQEFVQTRCPNKCECYLRPENKAFLMNCAYKGLMEAPAKLESPPDYNIAMNLTGNLLTNIPSLDQPGYNKVTILALGYNRISSLPFNESLQNLKILELNDNNLTRINKDVIVVLNASSLNKLTLHGNPWSCDCEAYELLKFIQSSTTKIPDLPKVNCVGDENPIVEMSLGDLCSKQITWIIGGCLIVVAFMGLIIGCLSVLCHRYQREMEVWLYARQWCLWFVTEDELDKDYLYDAFISYSQKDEDFVVNDLVPKLEGGSKPFKLCIRLGDWLTVESIPKQIARSVEESRRTIVVLSPNFLESVWGRMEFRAAHSQTLTEGRTRVIVVLYGDIGPIDDLNSELKAYLSTNTYIEWGDRLFWEKLKYALSHPSKLKKRNASKTTFETNQPHIGIENDKSMSTKPPNFPSTIQTVATTSDDAVQTLIPNDVMHNELGKPEIEYVNVPNVAVSPIVAHYDPKANKVKINKS